MVNILYASLDQDYGENCLKMPDLQKPWTTLKALFESWMTDACVVLAVHLCSYFK